MATTALITQLSSMVQELEALLKVLNDESCTTDELSALDMLGMKLADVTTTVQKKTGSFQPSCEAEVWRKSAELRSHVQSTIASIVNDGRLERPTVFRRNIVMIFAGPRDSVFDSEDVKSRKAATRLRCESIRRLSPDGVVAWAASYTTTSWAAGCMGKNLFACLVDDIESVSAQSWPPVVLETLQKLRTSEPLQDSLEFNDFLDGEYIECVKDGRIDYAYSYHRPLASWFSTA